MTRPEAWQEGQGLPARLAHLEAGLAQLGSVLVAFSGGADSAFLLAASVRALGAAEVVAATAVSPSLAAGELAAARTFARGLGVRHVTPRTDELSREGYRSKGGARCYFCKAELIEVLLPLAETMAMARVATGTNADDAAAGFRPGIRAAAERGAVTPLLDAGLTKADVRSVSRRWGLATRDKPAAAGLPVIDLRVRDLGTVARVEVDRDLVAALAARPQLLDAVRAAGFPAVEIDQRGFRSGAMNELLPDPVRYR